MRNNHFVPPHIFQTILLHLSQDPINRSLEVRGSCEAWPNGIAEIGEALKGLIVFGCCLDQFIRWVLIVLNRKRCIRFRMGGGYSEEKRRKGEEVLHNSSTGLVEHL